MEKERLRFFSAWLTHSIRSTRLPASSFGNLVEGKVGGYPPLPGVRVGENYALNIELPETEQTLVALSGLMSVFYRYISSTYDATIAKEKLLRPAREFVEKNRERVEALQLASIIPPLLGEVAGAPSPDERRAALVSGATLLPSGVPGFDALAGGGIPRNLSVLFQGPTGNEPELFANQFIRQGLEEKGPVLVIIATQSPADLRKALRAVGADPERAEADGLLRIIDWYSHRFERVSGIEEAGAVIKVSRDLTNVGIALNKAIRLMSGTGPKRAVVKVLTSALTEFPFETAFNFAESSRAKFKNNSVTALFLIDKESHPPATLSSMQKVFDGVVDLERRRVEVRVVSEVGVLSLTGVPVRSEYRPCMVDGNGRLVVGDTVVPAPPPVAPAPPAPAPPASVQPQSVPPAPVAPRSAPEATRVPPPPATTPPAPTAPPPRQPPAAQPQTASEASRQGKAERAMASSAQPRTPVSEAAALARTGRRTEALKAYDRILSTESDNLEALTGKALLLQIAGRNREALECYERAVALTPSDPELWSNRGIALRSLGRTEEAIASYDKALEISPRDAGVWSNRGIALRSLGRTEEAIESYDRALEINPRDAGAWSNRGVALTSLDRLEDALESFDRALEADPRYEKARKNREVLLEKMGR